MYLGTKTSIHFRCFAQISKNVYVGTKEVLEQRNQAEVDLPVSRNLSGLLPIDLRRITNIFEKSNIFENIIVKKCLSFWWYAGRRIYMDGSAPATGEVDQRTYGKGK